MLEWVEYPEDTEDTRTEYGYDELYRLASAETAVDSGYTLNVDYTYTDDLLTEIETNSTTYNFTYGLFAQSDTIKVGSRTLASYEYTADRNRYLQKMTYHNDVADDTVDENDFIQYNYDTQGRLILETYEDGDTVAYTYDNNGALATVTDSATGRKTTYYYDFTDRLMKYTESGTNFYHSVGYEYDSLNNLTSLIEIINGVEHSTTYTYDDDNRVSTSTVSVNNGQVVINTDNDYDSFGRLYTTDTWTALTDGFTKEYRYTGHSTQVNELQVDIEYTIIAYLMNYDDNGNITSAVVGDYNSGYAYDTANQLIRENNSGAGKTWVWAYDDAGNILSRTEYAYTTGELGDPIDTVLYTYGDSEWGDLLTAYDGKTITYDGIGNLVTYDGWMYTWEHGRELSSMTDGTTTWDYTYDANGMRTSRTDGTTTYDYIYNGSKLVQMTVGDNTLQYIYNSMGEPVALLWNGTLYYIVTNLQGDVHLILDTNNEIVVSYEYDAWGNIYETDGTMATTLGALNPLRYRGYVYDQDTGLYYLQSRYYNPEWGRFINADAFVSTGQGFVGNNMYAYCLNNPVLLYDPSGAVARISNQFHLAQDDGCGGGGPDNQVNLDEFITCILNSIFEAAADFVSNTNEETTFDNLNTYGFAFYNGAFVVATPFDASFSYGFIGISTSQLDPNVLKHEYGHIVQMRNMGLADYTVNVALPSVTINLLSRNGKLPYDYYSYPWEAEANQLGGSTLSQWWKSSLPEGGCTSYWDLIQLFFK